MNDADTEDYYGSYEEVVASMLKANAKLNSVRLTDNERAALRALIENEMGDGSSKFGGEGRPLVRLDHLLDKLQDDNWLDA